MHFVIQFYEMDILSRRYLLTFVAPLDAASQARTGPTRGRNPRKRCDPGTDFILPDREMRAPQQDGRGLCASARPIRAGGQGVTLRGDAAPVTRRSRRPPRHGWRGGWRARSAPGRPATVAQSRDAARSPRAPARAGSTRPPALRPRSPLAAPPRARRRCRSPSEPPIRPRWPLVPARPRLPAVAARLARARLARARQSRARPAPALLPVTAADPRRGRSARWPRGRHRPRCS